MRIAVSGKEQLAVEALASLLNFEGKFDVVARGTSPRDVLTKAKESTAWVVVVDVQKMDPKEVEFFMGARTFGDFGIALVVPESQKEQFEHHEADAYIVREEGTLNMFEKLRAMSTRFARTIPGRVRDGRSKGYNAELNLTRREFEVASLIAKGFANRRVSLVTGLKEQSVKNLVSVIMRKMQCDNRTQLALRVLGSNSYQATELAEN